MTSRSSAGMRTTLGLVLAALVLGFTAAGPAGAKASQPTPVVRSIDPARPVLPALLLDGCPPQAGFLCGLGDAMSGAADKMSDAFTSFAGTVKGWLKRAGCFYQDIPFSPNFMEMEWCEKGPRGPRPECALIPEQHEKEAGRPNLGGLLPDRCWGTYPSSYYDYNYDTGDALDVQKKITGNLTGLAFSAGKGLTQIGLWLTEKGYSWDAEANLKGVGDTLASRWQGGLVGPFELAFVAWFVMIVWLGYTMLRGKASHGVAEIAISILLAVIAGQLDRGLSGYRADTLKTLRKVSDAVLIAGDEGRAPDADEGKTKSTAILAGHLRKLHIAFVEQPYDHLNWGRSLGGYAKNASIERSASKVRTDEKGNRYDCNDERDVLIERGPHGGSDYAREIMSHKKSEPKMGGLPCLEEAKYNGSVSWDKFFASLLYLVAAAFMFSLLAVIALTILLAKMGVVILFGLTPFAAVLAILPGGGRRLAWKWFTTILSLIVVVALMSFVLACLIIMVGVFLENPDGTIEPIERFLILDVFVIGAVVTRKRLLSMGLNLRNTLGERLTSMTPVQASSWGDSGGGVLGSSMPQMAAAYALYKGTNNLWERRKRRVDSNRGLRNHARFMVDHGLQGVDAPGRGFPVPGGAGGGAGGAGGGAGGAAPPNPLGWWDRMIAPRYNNLSYASRVGNRWRGIARRHTNRVRMLNPRRWF